MHPSKWTNRFAFEPWQKTLWITFFAQLISVIGFSTIFPFLPLYVKDLGSRGTLSVEFMSGLVFSSQAFTMMLTAPLWGALADRFGRKLMIQRAMYGGAITVLLMGYADSAETLIVLRTLQGLVTGTVSAANALIAATVPRERLGFAMGLMQVALYGGVSIGPLLGGVMADAYGYRLAFTVTAILLLLGGIIVWWGVDEQFTPRENEGNQKRSLFGDWGHILRAPGVKTAYLIRFLMGLGRTILVPIAPLFLLELIDTDASINLYSGLVIAAGSGASTITAVVLGRLGDRVGHRRILLYSALTCVLFYLPQGFVQTLWQLLILQILGGAGLGGLITSVTALLGQYTQPGEEGSVYGFDSALTAASRVVAPLLGASIALWFSLRWALSFTGILYLAIFMLAFWLMPKAKS